MILGNEGKLRRVAPAFHRILLRCREAGKHLLERLEGISQVTAQRRPGRPLLRRNLRRTAHDRLPLGIRWVQTAQKGPIERHHLFVVRMRFEILSIETARLLFRRFPPWLVLLIVIDTHQAVVAHGIGRIALHRLLQSRDTCRKIRLFGLFGFEQEAICPGETDPKSKSLFGQFNSGPQRRPVDGLAQGANGRQPHQAADHNPHSQSNRKPHDILRVLFSTYIQFSR
jgi:hypothetical protein